MTVLVHELERPFKEKIGMRILITNMLAVAALLFGATSASAFAINWAPRGATNSLTTSDTVTVDVFLDAETGLQALSVGVLYPDDGTVAYDAAASDALPPSGPGLSGSSASYILYTPASGSMLTAMPATYLVPQQVPWGNWPGNLPAGQLQVNINYAEVALSGATASGTGIYIATLVFHIEPGFTGATLQLCNTCGGNVLSTAFGGPPIVIAPGDIPLGAPIELTGVPVPEPTTAMLIGLGVLGLAVAGRRRA
jgi:hypothetical protein